MSEQDTTNDEYPSELVQTIELMTAEVQYIHKVWSQVTTLFMEKDTMDVIFSAAFGFFWLVRWVFLNEVVMAICRLDDNASHQKKKATYHNLSFEYLWTLIDDEQVRDEAKALYAGVEAHMAPLRRHRDKRLGHNDLLTKQEAEGMKLDPIEYEAIEAILAVLRRVMHTVEGRYGCGQPIYEWHRPFFDATSLVEALKDRSYTPLAATSITDSQ